MIADLLIVKVKNYNFNVTEVLVSGIKNAFPGIFNSTVGILAKPRLFSLKNHFQWYRNLIKLEPISRELKIKNPFLNFSFLAFPRILLFSHANMHELWV